MTSINEEILAAIKVLASLAQQQSQSNNSEQVLGFCDPPSGGTAIYVDDKTGSFYKHHGDRPVDDQKEFIKQRAVKGKVKLLKTGVRDFEGEENLKLRLDLMTDVPLMLEKGIATNFTRGLLFSLARLGTQVNDIITIEISVPSDLKKATCFCNIYDCNNQRVTPQSRYDLSQEEFDWVNQNAEALNQILKERKTTAKKEYEKIADLQAEEESLLLSLIERINRKLR
jgi:hypothetical protein